MQIIIYGKCQIRFPASEVQYRKLPVFIKLRQNVFDKFQEPVNLPEFIKPGIHDLALFCHNSKLQKKRNRNSLFQHILFPAVMAPVYFLFFDALRLCPLLYRYLSLLAYQYGI